MALKTILVHLDDPARAQRLLEAAVPLARVTEAHLIGLCVMPPYVVVPETAGMATAVTTVEHRERYKDHIAALKRMFADLGRQGPFTSEWREADAMFGTVAEIVMAQGRSSDLIICSQPDPDWTYSGLEEAADELAISSGRPVLIIPNHGTIALPPRRAVIAWNGRREAARAAFDALHLLPASCEISVLSIDDGSEPDGAEDVPGAELSTVLSRHGFRCTAAVVPALSRSAGQVILHEAAARGADLVVMGAYGHSRFREFFLGGVSRHIFKEMQVPVLMSH